MFYFYYFFWIMGNTWKLITFDWPDGVWKSTIAKLLAEENGWVYYKTPGSVTIEERNRYDRPEISAQERFNFYVWLLAQDVDRIKALLQEGINVFCDRFIISTMVHHKAMDETIDIGKSKNILSEVMVACAVILHGDIDIMLSRIHSRKKQTRFEIDRDLMIRAQEKFMTQPHVYLFDNTNNSIAETMKNINYQLKELKIID